MKVQSRDNFKWTIAKFFMAALLVLFFCIGATNALIRQYHRYQKAATNSVAFAAAACDRCAI